jgi:hypothetical protein
MHNSGVYRNYFMSQALAEKSATISWVLTTDNVKLMAQDQLPVSEKITVETIYTLDYRTLMSKLKPTREHGGSQLKESQKSSSFIQFVIRMQRSFPFFLLMAEGSIFYIFKAYRRAAQLVKTENISVVYSSFMPYADHVVAWMLKRKFPHLVWVADFRDLHLEPIYKNTLWPGLQRWFERRILSKADIVTSVSDGLCDKLKDYHANVMTITKGVTLRPERKLYEVFTISYVGGLFREFRDPRPVFNALRKWIEIDKPRIVFKYVGKDGAQMRAWARECGIEDIFHDVGFVSREDASIAQDRSHLNLLLTSSSDDHKGVLTGKLFDYMESRRPILCSVNGVYDEELESFFDNYKIGTIFYHHQEAQIMTFLSQAYRQWSNSGQLIGVSDFAKIEAQLSWAGQAQKTINAISKIKYSEF